MELVDEAPELVDEDSQRLPRLPRRTARAEPEAAPRPKRFKKKRGMSEGQKTLWTLVGIDVGASLLLAILFAAQAPLAAIILILPMYPLHFIGISFASFGVMLTLVFVRGAVGAGLGFLQHIGQDIARVIHGGLLLAQGALAGIGVIMGIVDLIRAKAQFGERMSLRPTASGVIMIIIAVIWAAGHGVLGGMFMKGRGFDSGPGEDY